MRHELFGTARLADTETSVVLGGRLAFVSDGASRSEIIIGDADGGKEERLVFTIGTTWMAVYQLIQVIRDLYQADELEVHVSSPDDPCVLCGGLGLYEDEEGNWRDCRQCVP